MPGEVDAIHRSDPILLGLREELHTPASFFSLLHHMSYTSWSRGRSGGGGKGGLLRVRRLVGGRRLWVARRLWGARRLVEGKRRREKGINDNKGYGGGGKGKNRE